MGEKDKEKIINEVQSPPKAIVPIPPIPFTQKLKKNRLGKEFEKFIKMFRQLHINIPFADATV